MNAKTIKSMDVGSNAFFKEYTDFVPHDNDKLFVIDKPVFGNRTMLIRTKDTDKFILCINKHITKQILIENTKDYYQACKFITPEFIDYINELGLNFTIEDLKEIRHFFDDVKDKHLYTQYICDMYIKNYGFFLTEEQLNEAYKIYKKFR